MTEFEAASLLAQWVGSGAAVAAVGVAVVFGILTLSNSRRSIDAQERATAALDTDPHLAEMLSRGSQGDPVWAVEKRPTKDLWWLRNVSDHRVWNVRITGATTQDTERLRFDWSSDSEPMTADPNAPIPFRTLNFWGAAAVPTIIVEWADEPDGQPRAERIAVAEGP
ncbi:hypothetical protein [Microbacterium sp. VKM Ac-2923]|uniref:hypothetical protein n=1 Tax=Microbacterium sp. VKM Ac-2923 TaxID=2929476 RepID=UPI001FB4E50D|nr:hypothetical protein [Microbacterium sp. VKM Ac-2923]MCJ1709538.1 hypothetical protein [Microbacterium sp. VKM Ac-2923]